MAKEYNIKETVTTLIIYKQAQKIKFQIRHPENVHAIIGIAVTSNMKAPPPGEVRSVIPKGDNVGYIALSIPGKGDIVYGDDVKLDNNEYADLLEQALWELSLPISQAKHRQFYFETFYKIDKALLEGFYEDVYFPTNSYGVIGISPKQVIDGYGTMEVAPALYKIRIYIRYQVKEISKTQLQ